MKHLNKNIHVVKQVQSAALHAGFKQDSEKNDLALIYFPNKATIAGVFTQNLVKAWPVIHGQTALKETSEYSAILINSGNANACNGEVGQQVMHEAIELLADALAVPSEEILVSSTGVIGARLSLEPFKENITPLVNNLQAESGKLVAEAIMTTDTVAKETAYSIEIDGTEIHMGAIAKGSGMIHPNLGTMLAYITTDIACDQETLATLLKQAVDASFNSMTVDGDTSTNDTVLLCATGEKVVDLTTENLAKIQALVTQVCTDLAKKIAQDGEGLSKFMTINVLGATNAQDARTVGKSIATSSLVKTAFYGEDPNWGRVLSAIGNSQVADIDPLKIDILFKSVHGSVQPCKNGSYHPFDINAAEKILTAAEIEIEINLNIGEASATVWTCDLTHDYIVINADYHT